MEIELNYEQRAHIELISMHAGKPAADVLLEAAEFLLRLDPACFRTFEEAEPQSFLSDAELEARFARILRN